MKKKLVIGAVLISALGLAYLLLCLRMRADLGYYYPDSGTSTTMAVMKRRVLHYAKGNGKLPNAVDQLPLLEGFHQGTDDEWGGKILMQIDGNTVRLVSYGRDKKPGGTGADLDLVAVFDAKTAEGEWANEDNDFQWKEHFAIRWDKDAYK
jgi:hypothetical protein